MGRKSYEITASSTATGVWFDWVESLKLSMSRVILSRGTLLWLCKKLREASTNRGKSFKSWRCKDITTYIYCTQKFNKFGRYISVITVKGLSRTVIIVPENKFNEGWENLADRMEAFITKFSSTQGAFITEGESSKTFTGKGNYIGAIKKSKWSQEGTAARKENQEQTRSEDNALLHRCLVGKFTGGEEAPLRNEVRRWAMQTWRGIPNIQVYDRNGFYFLFEFQTRKVAEHIFMGEWRRQGQVLEFKWWSPTISALPESLHLDWFWIRVLGLPLHLWNSEVMKQIRDACGGWLENEEETELKNHLRWARIRVRGPRQKIPSEIEVADDDFIYSLPIWCEAPALYRKMKVNIGCNRENILGSSSVLDTTKKPADNHGKGIGFIEEDCLKSDLYKERKIIAGKDHVPRGGLSLQMGPSLSACEEEE
ncbi:hypothetical protein KY290_035830 [Solanum tuberosum]|uniref:DUF4283 domain-containing protein n=1 Tax=Solanum tuberosum TaxID=4113 RepID=A0ABQ7TRK3_SOLTU|nr:hypothetical protein KY284_035193 [Solanum tuberosum]KAH0737125.1 hypothetical protein KY290_035830 [Solanum tuberosum]